MAFQHRLGLRIAALTAMAAAVSGPVAAAAVVGAVGTTRNQPIDVQISRLTPTMLTSAANTRKGTLTIAGVLRNRHNHRWADVQVYLVAPTAPFIGHGQARVAISSGEAYTGRRLVARGTFDNVGDLKPGDERGFSITIPRSALQLSGEEGVYPIGVQVLATDVDGSRQGKAVGRATTFLPLRGGKRAPAAALTVVWPFLLPYGRRSDRRYPDLDALAASIGPDGQLRHLLDLAKTSPRRGSDLLIDPGLLAAVESLAHSAGKTTADAARRKAASDFLADLVHLTQRLGCGTIGFARPDLLAIANSPSRRDLSDAVERATTGTLKGLGLTCIRMEWPSARSVSRTLLTALRRSGTAAVIVGPPAVPQWQSTTGNVLQRRTLAGRLPLFVDDRLDTGVPGTRSLVTLRQAILSEAVFSSIAAQATKSKPANVFLVSSALDPGPVKGSPLDAAFKAPVVGSTDLSKVLKSGGTAYTGPIPDRATTRPIRPIQVAAAIDAAKSALLLDTLLVDPADKTEHAQIVATAVSQAWRRNNATGLDAAMGASNALSEELADITVEGPRALTLSSQSGQFPVTVRNRTTHRVHIALAIDSTANRVTFKAPADLRVAAGESRTITVDINLHGDTATTVSVQLRTPTRQTFGMATVFNVRSSRVGAALWAAIGLSVAFVAVALVRRFARPGHRPTHAVLPPGDFDD